MFKKVLGKFINWLICFVIVFSISVTIYSFYFYKTEIDLVESKDLESKRVCSDDGVVFSSSDACSKIYIALHDEYERNLYYYKYAFVYSVLIGVVGGSGLFTIYYLVNKKRNYSITKRDKK